MRVEEQFLGALNNMEFEIVALYQNTPTLNNYEVLAAIDALSRLYRAEEDHYPTPTFQLPEKGVKLFEVIKPVCEWCLGREKAPNRENAKLLEKQMSVSEVRVCLKRIEKSIKTWTKAKGSQGYLQYVSRFFNSTKR
ncbi:MAG: hypothetical protein AABZ60_13345 [Planctomycetota bacterium]